MFLRVLVNLIGETGSSDKMQVAKVDSVAVAIGRSLRVITRSSALKMGQVDANTYSYLFNLGLQGRSTANDIWKNYRD